MNPDEQTQSSPQRLTQNELMLIWAILLRIGTVSSVVEVSAISLEDALDVFRLAPKLVWEISTLNMELGTLHLIHAAELRQATQRVVEERQALIQWN
jgi:hypothetical protein